ncbi:rod shape-determining protein MreC [Alistipes sp.]|uniref:rod shape-determining protein MreC n=1 Tax=Alistipes sp. TaxID=1872444 RepID=UPI003AF0F569
MFEFIRSIYVVVLFVLLEALAVSYYAHATCYTQARLLARSNQVAGGVHGLLAGIRRYFLLGDENRALLAYAAELKERLARYEEAESIAGFDTALAEIGESKYRVMNASVISNTLNRAQNLIVLNRGTRDGVVADMAVVSPDGAMVGYVVDCTERYAVALSVLNTSFRASGKLADSDYFGSVYWDGVDPDVVTLGELSKYSEPQPGQAVVSAGFSQYFPAGVKIGVVESAVLNPTRTSYTARVRLTARIARLTDVLLVENRDLYEIRDLENSEKVKQHTRQK